MVVPGTDVSHVLLHPVERHGPLMAALPHPQVVEDDAEADGPIGVVDEHRLEVTHGNGGSIGDEADVDGDHVVETVLRWERPVESQHMFDQRSIPRGSKKSTKGVPESPDSSAH